jgi:hypothetical protein
MSGRARRRSGQQAGRLAVAATVAVLALAGLPLVDAAVVGSVASGQPARSGRPGAARSTFQPPGFATGARRADQVTGPAPYVQDFGSPSEGARAGPAASPTVTISARANLDGCDHAYGTAGQCVPWTFPAGVSDRCGWLHAHNFGALPIHGPDRLGLDPNHDGIACGPGDR